mgnify:CR=1 FL=1
MTLDHRPSAARRARGGSVMISPIRSEADHKAALIEMERLWGAPIDTPEGDRLDILMTLVAAYEDEHHPMDPPDPIDAILFRLEQMGQTRKALEPLIGGRGRVSEVLGRKRALSVRMIRAINAKLGVPAEILIRETRKKAKPAAR